MSRVVHFEVAIDDPTRAQRFFEGALGWTIQKWGGPGDYWLAMTGDPGAPGIDGGLTPRQPNFPSVVNVLGVESVDDLAVKIADLGGSVIVPKMPVPGVGYLIYFSDSEGNVWGAMQSDPGAM